MGGERPTESEFEARADQELHQLLDRLIDSGEEVDPDLAAGVLSIRFDDGATYVVNSHRAARQIWLAAERRAWHFDLDVATSCWVTRTDPPAELRATIAELVGHKLGCEIALR